MLLGESPDEQVLRTVRILIFVDENVQEFTGVFRARRLARLEQLDGLEQKIVEVERARVTKRSRVGFVHPGDVFVARAPRAAAQIVR